MRNFQALQLAALLGVSMVSIAEAADTCTEHFNGVSCRGKSNNHGHSAVSILSLANRALGEHRRHETEGKGTAASCRAFQDGDDLLRISNRLAPSLGALLPSPLL